MKSLAQEPKYTTEQYLKLERTAATKSELINGCIVAMSGASKEHNQITLNIAAELIMQLKERSCVTYASDMRVKVSETGLYTYPDVVGTCGEPQVEDAHGDTLLNPSLIIEVLSDSTEAYDRGSKFAHYQRLPSLKEYVLVAQNEIRLERYVRQEQQWIYSETNDRERVITLSSIDCTLFLSAVYNKVTFVR